MLMMKSHICLAQDWFAIDERFEGAGKRGELPQHLIEFFRESRESCGKKSTGFFLYGIIK